jgi:hypothetical protein
MKTMRAVKWFVDINQHLPVIPKYAWRFFFVFRFQTKCFFLPSGSHVVTEYARKISHGGKTRKRIELSTGFPGMQKTLGIY